MAQINGTVANGLGMATSDDVVEIGLLLPVSWANALLEMSRRRHETVGQILRGMIDRGLVDDRSSNN